MGPTLSPETSAFKLQTPGKFPEEYKLQSQFIPLQNVVYFITLPFLVRKIFTFYINDVLLFKCPFSGPKGKIVVYVLEYKEKIPCHI